MNMTKKFKKNKKDTIHGYVYLKKYHKIQVL